MTNLKYDFTTPFVVNDKPMRKQFKDLFPDCPMSVNIAYKRHIRVWLRTRAGESQNWRCCWCGKKTELGAENKGNSATLEHIIPVSKGGTNDFENLALACFKCNHKRGDMSIDDFMNPNTVNELEKARQQRNKEKIISRAKKLSENKWSRKGRKIDPKEWISSISIDTATKNYIMENFI